jgi:hypothetical protein
VGRSKTDAIIRSFIFRLAAGGRSHRGRSYQSWLFALPSRLDDCFAIVFDQTTVVDERWLENGLLGIG